MMCQSCEQVSLPYFYRKCQTDQVCIVVQNQPLFEKFCVHYTWYTVQGDDFANYFARFPDRSMHLYNRRLAV